MFSFIPSMSNGPTECRLTCGDICFESKVPGSESISWSRGTATTQWHGLFTRLTSRFHVEILWNGLKWCLNMEEIIWNLSMECKNNTILYNRFDSKGNVGLVKAIDCCLRGWCHHVSPSNKHQEERLYREWLSRLFCMPRRSFINSLCTWYNNYI